MESKNKKEVTALPDDLLVLKREYALTRLNYQDISLQEKLVEILKKWPLIAEFAGEKNPGT